MNLHLGDIGFSNNKEKSASGVLASIIRFFTKSQWSHSFIIQSPLGDQETVQEASVVVEVVPFQRNYRDSKTETYTIFRPIKADPEKVKESLKYCFDEFAGVSYGKLQLIWFVYRAVMEKLGKDIRHEKNWMSDGVICSELTYYFLTGLGGEYAELLAPWNADTIQPEDIYQIVLAHPELFELVEKKD